MPTDRNYEMLRRYLLGDLSEQEAGSLEERLLAEDELFELAEAVEADLLDAHAHRELPAEERQRVVERLAASPRGRDRLATARSLAKRPSPGHVIRFPALRRAFRERPGLRHALAAGLAAMLIGVFSMMPGLQDQQTTVTFDIHLENTRSEGEEIEALTVPPGTDRIELRLELEDRSYEGFRAAIEAQGREVWKGERLEPEGPYLVMRIPASALPPGSYVLALDGLLSQGETEPIAFVELEIVRP